MSEVVEIDARRLFCPLPVIRLQNRVESLGIGERVHIVATDPGSLRDIPAWCRINGHRVVDSQEQDREFHFVVEKGEDPYADRDDG